MQKAAVLLTLSIAAASAGCVDASRNANSPAAPATAAANDNNQPKTNAEELGLHVRMPYETEDIAWRMSPDKKRILAVMRYSSADAERLVNEAGSQGDQVSVEAEPWFPEDLIAQSEMSGDSALKGTSMPATAFLQPPYGVGKITRVTGTNYFILEVSAQ